MNKVLFKGIGSHGVYQVVEWLHNGRPSRLLLSGRSAPQSGLALDDDPELLFDYNQRFLEIALSIRPQSVLVIGGGAFTFPKALVERFGEAKVDVVEIDELLPELGRKYFDLPNSPNMKIITEDGRSYIDRSQSKYDLIVVDAFAEYDIPKTLMSVQATAQYARLLSREGILALNVISTYFGKPSIAHQLLASFSKSFKSTELYPADPSYGQNKEQNLILVATNGPAPNLDYLQSFCVHPRVPVDESMQIND